MSSNEVRSFDPWKAIPRSDFLQRQKRAREAIARAGLEGALVWSKGGAFMDMSADVLYLSNHYPQYPYVGDEAGLGSGRGHAAVLIPVDGPMTLVVDAPFWDPDLVVADVVKASPLVPETLADSVAEAGLARGRLAFVGAGYMTASSYLRMRELLSSVELVREDRLIEDLRIHKSAAEIDVIRRAAAVGDDVMDRMMSAASEGATEAIAAAEAARTAVATGAVLYDAACASGPRSQHFTYARLPSADPIRRLQRGDLFHVDCYGCYGGYFFDLARSKVIGDKPSPGQLDLLEALIEGVHTICDEIKPGLTGSELHRVGSRWATKSRFVQSLVEADGGGSSGIGLDQDRSGGGILSFGHGIGLGWERPWMAAHDHTVVEANMYLAVEIMIGNASIGGAMFENTGLVTDHGFELFSNAREKWW